MRRCFALVVVVAGTTACVNAPIIVPAPDTPTVFHHPDEAVSDLAGVHLVLATDAWKSNPPDLAIMVTPLEVTLENHSGHALRVRLTDFGLKTSTGFQARALPPYRINTPGPGTALAPDYAGTGFFVAPPFAGLYPGYAPWTGPYETDPLFYNGYSNWTAPLPTPDMLSRALPEGVLDNHGRVRGFLYFQRVPNQTQTLTFVALYADAHSGQEIGQSALPLSVNP